MGWVYELLSYRSAPRTDVSASGVQNESGFDGGRGTTGTGGLENTEQGRGAEDLLSTGGTHDTVLLDEKIGVILGRTFASEATEGPVGRHGRQRGWLRR